VSHSTVWDAIIVGQGLAGTTLAWHLLESNQRVLVLDAEAPVTSSKIAAGLMTPITGQQLALSWQVHDLLPVAREFYTRVERRTGASFYHPRTAVRLFHSDKERRTWQKRQTLPAYLEHLLTPQPTPLLASNLLVAALGNAHGDGFAMHAAQLDVAAYLAASRVAFAARGPMM
jgi:glycine oxidase